MGWFKKLQEAGDCSKVTPADGQILRWSATTRQWEIVNVPSGSESDPLSVHLDQSTPQTIINLGSVTAVDADYVLINDTSDSGKLKKALKTDFAGGGGGMAIGSPVSGGTANEVLFIDASGNLADNAGFRFDNYDLFINNLSNSGTTVQIGASGLIIKDALYGDLLFSVSDEPEGQVSTLNNVLDDGSGNMTVNGANVSIANTSDYSSGGINIISDNLRGNITLGGNGYYNDVGRLLFYSYDKNGILGYLTWRDDIDGFEIFSGDPGSPTLLMSMTSSGTILDNLKSGTLVSPPAGLAIGELWQDTTTSAQYPIVRIRKT